MPPGSPQEAPRGPQEASERLSRGQNISKTRGAFLVFEDVLFSLPNLVQGSSFPFVDERSSPVGSLHHTVEPAMASSDAKTDMMLDMMLAVCGAD